MADHERVSESVTFGLLPDLADGRASEMRECRMVRYGGVSIGDCVRWYRARLRTWWSRRG